MPEKAGGFTAELVERLEEVRKETGLSLKEWWKLLKRAEDFDYSYEGIRRYHRDREAPVSYLVHVAERYDVSLIWLTTGARTKPSDSSEGLAASVEGVHDAAADLFLFGPSAYTEITSLLFAIQEASGAESTDSLEEGSLLIGSAINDWALAPLVALSPEGLTRNQKAAFFQLLMTAVQMLVPNPGEGSTLKEIAEKWLLTMGRRHSEGEG